MDANGLNDWILWFFYSFFGTFEVHQMEVKDLPSSTNPEKTPTDIHVDFFGKKNVGEKNTQNLHDISQSLHDVPILFFDFEACRLNHSIWNSPLGKILNLPYLCSM